MEDPIRCDNCGRSWRAEVLGQIHHYWERVEPGGVVPLGQCPNTACGALCYPPYGYVYELEQQLHAMRDVLARLLDWSAFLGGFEAPVWEEARLLLAPHDATDEAAADSRDI